MKKCKAYSIYTLKALICAIYLIILALLFCACQEEQNSGGFRDDIKISEISDKIEAHIKDSRGLKSVGGDIESADFLSASFGIDSADIEEYKIRVHTNSCTIDEYGIFKLSDTANPILIKEKIDGYIEKSFADKKSWLMSYNPSQLPKFENAGAEIFGDYVIYGILDDSTRTAALKDVKKLLGKQ